MTELYLVINDIFIKPKKKIPVFEGIEKCLNIFCINVDESYSPVVILKILSILEMSWLNSKLK